MVQTVDLTKVSISAKSMVWMTIAFTLVLVAYGVGQFGAAKVRGMMKGVTSGVTEKAEETF